jgi:hypothetical protein
LTFNNFILEESTDIPVHKKQDTERLQDIKENIGFPRAPNPNGLTAKDVDNDLTLLGLK